MAERRLRPQNPNEAYSFRSEPREVQIYQALGDVLMRFTFDTVNPELKDKLTPEEKRTGSMLSHTGDADLVRFWHRTIDGPNDPEYLRAFMNYKPTKNGVDILFVTSTERSDAKYSYTKECSRDKMNVPYGLSEPRLGEIMEEFEEKMVDGWQKAADNLASKSHFHVPDTLEGE